MQADDKKPPVLDKCTLGFFENMFCSIKFEEFVYETLASIYIYILIFEWEGAGRVEKLIEFKSGCFLKKCSK